jgi:LemA protein
MMAMGIASIVLLWFIVAMNDLRRTEVMVGEALADIDVALTKRYDVLVKMLTISRNFATFEKETMLETIRLRSGMSMKERNQAVNAMDQSGHILQAVAEDYPELRSNENFKQLQISVMDVEEHLQAARRFYNGNVSKLNQKIVSFPSSMIASLLHINQADFLEMEDAKRQDISMNIM